MKFNQGYKIIQICQVLFVNVFLNTRGVSASKCFTSVQGTSLIGYVFMMLSNTDIYQCFQHCKEETRCQSLNYYISSNTCHLSNRTIAHRPEDTRLDSGSVYFENPYKVSLGSVPSMPASSCAELKRASSTGVSGVFWLINASSVMQGYCNLTTGLMETCTGNPCQHGGTCHYQGSGNYKCVCTSGFTGANCETNMDDCAGSPCQNGATCVDGINKYTCTCAGGYTGTHCETDINECASSPCLNGATCNDGVNLFSCSCVPGYIGVRCETNINECASNPCLNGGTCLDGVNKYTCSCASGYIGTRCETVSSECNSYAQITDGTRNINQPKTATVCDQSIETKWYRFTGSAGTRMPTSCVPINKCNTDATGWLNGAHPTVAQGIVTRQVCFHWSSNCCNWSVNIQIRNCGDSFYVYRLVGTPNCQLRYCST